MPAKKKVAKRKSKSFNKVMYLKSTPYGYSLFDKADINNSDIYFDMCTRDAEKFGFSQSQEIRKVRITVTEVK